MKSLSVFLMALFLNQNSFAGTSNDNVLVATESIWAMSMFGGCGVSQTDELTYLGNSSFWFRGRQVTGPAFEIIKSDKKSESSCPLKLPFIIEIERDHMDINKVLQFKSSLLKAEQHIAHLKNVGVKPGSLVAVGSGADKAIITVLSLSQYNVVSDRGAKWYASYAQPLVSTHKGISVGQTVTEYHLMNSEQKVLNISADGYFQLEDGQWYTSDQIGAKAQ